MTKVLGRLLLAGALLVWTIQTPTLSAAEADGQASDPFGVCYLLCAVLTAENCPGNSGEWCLGFYGGCLIGCGTALVP